MHAGFQFVFGSFLPHRFAGATSNSGIFYILQNSGIAKADPGFFNSPMTGCVAIATRDLKTTCREG